MLETKFVAQDNKFPIHFEEIFRYDNINNSPKDVLEILNQIKSKINENINLLSNNIYDKNYKLYYSDYINKLDTFIKELKEYSNFENKKNHKCYDIKYYENITLELKNLERQFNFYNIETFKKNIESYNNNLNNNVIFEEKELENKINENITKNELKTGSQSLSFLKTEEEREALLFFPPSSWQRKSARLSAQMITEQIIK